VSVVRNEEIPEMGAFAKAVAWAVKEMTASAGISGSALARRLGRAQSYASVRLNGRKAWTLDELDRIADMIGTTVDALMSRAASMRE